MVVLFLLFPLSFPSGGFPYKVIIDGETISQGKMSIYCRFEWVIERIRCFGVVSVYLTLGENLVSEGD